jgi:hypothetical protein
MAQDKFRKIITGSKAYVARVAKEWQFYGYVVVKSKLWSDGKYTIVMEKRPESVF